MREIIFDTETTGLDHRGGDRLVEIGCLELINHIPTGKHFHRYVNPERPVPPDAVRVHGHTDSFLADKPRFSVIVHELIEFLADAMLIAHNASFDLGFLNAELARAGLAPIAEDRVVDTLMLARRKHPAGPNSLDALCARYQIDSSRRTLHGALLDAELLAEVYIELIGGRQTHLVLGEAAPVRAATLIGTIATVVARPVPREFTITGEELAAHAAAVERLGEAALWRAHLDKAGQ